MLHIPLFWYQTQACMDGEYELKADSDENTKKQRTIFDAIMRKCGCKSSRCLSNRCSCKKHGSACSSLCSCLNCENNIHTKTDQQRTATSQQMETEDEEEQLTPSAATFEPVENEEEEEQMTSESEDGQSDDEDFDINT